MYGLAKLWWPREKTHNRNKFNLFWKRHCFLLVIFIFIKSVYWWRMVEEIHVIRIDFQSQRQGSYSGKNKIIKLSSNGDTLRPLRFFFFSFYFQPWETPTHFVTQVWPSWFLLSSYDRKSSGRYICTEIRELYRYNLTLSTGKTGALVCFVCLFFQFLILFYIYFNAPGRNNKFVYLFYSNDPSLLNFYFYTSKGGFYFFWRGGLF